MMRLNLLGDEAKKKIEKSITMITLINGAIVLAATTTILTGIFVAGKECLSRKMQIVGERGVSVEEVRVEEVNRKMAQLSQLQEKYIKWSETLKNVVGLIPEGIKIYRLEIDRDSGILRINGLAQTRDNYLTLEKQLRESELVEKINAPVANLLKPKDIAFNLEATLKLVK